VLLVIRTIVAMLVLLLVALVGETSSTTWPQLVTGGAPS
jgi:hypothetical protein